MPVAQLGVYWPFKTLLQGSGISITEDATTIRITNTGGTGGGSGDMLSSQYATNGNPGVVDHAVVADGLSAGAVVDTAQVAQSVPWNGVTGAPTSFPSDWSQITSIPSVFPPATHGLTHRGKGLDPIALADTNDSGLLVQLDGKTTSYVGGDNALHDLPTQMQQYGALPPGSCIQYYGTTLPGPANTWLFANGGAYSRTTFAALYAVLGTKYGAGDGSTTFNVPNLNGRVGIGAGGSYSLGAVGGEATHTLIAGEMPSHSHGVTVSDPGHQHAFSLAYQAHGLDVVYGNNMGINWHTGYTNAAATGIGVGLAAAGGSGAHNNMQPYLVCNYIIKT